MSIGDLVIGLTANTSRFQNDMGQASNVLDRFASRAITTSKQAEKAIQQMSDLGITSCDRLQRSFNALSIKSGLDIEKERRSITAAFDQIKNSGVASASEITRAHSAMKDKLSSLDTPLNKASLGFGGLGTAAMGAMAGFSVQQVISQLHEAGMAAERLRNSMATVAGSSGAGQLALGFVRAEAVRLGLDLLSTSDAFLKLSASAKGTALEGQATKDIFSAVAGAGRAIGMTSDQMSGSLLAISQMMSKGTVQAEELRGQLGERLPGAFNIAARAMGVTTAELGKMLEGGKVLSEDFLPKFAVELAKTFPPGTDSMAGLTAETMRLKTAWFELKETVMKNGGESMFTGAVRNMKGLVSEADTFYNRMANAWGVLKDIAAHPLTPHGSPAPAQKYAPVTQSEMMLMNPDYGISGNILKTGINPDFGTLAARPYTVDFGKSLTRDNEPEEVKKAKGQKPTDLLLKQILSYESDMQNLMTAQEKIFYDMGQEIERTSKSAAAVFTINTMQTGDLSTGNRYNGPTPLNYSKPSLMGDMFGPQNPQAVSAGYRLMTDQQYSLSQSAPDPKQYIQEVLDRAEEYNFMQEKIRASSPWLGMKDGLNDYAASVGDIGKQFDDFATNSMRSVEDALVNMTMTGKASFKDMANSIIADMVRIATRQAITAPLSASLSGLIGNMFSGGGTNDGYNPSTVYAGSSPGPWAGPSFAVGTNYVPNDMVAKVHKGEAIIPAYENSKSNNGNVNLKVEIINASGQPQKAKDGGTKFDGAGMVKTIILEAMDTDPGFRWAMRGGA